MHLKIIVCALCCALILGVSGCKNTNIKQEEPMGAEMTILETLPAVIEEETKTVLPEISIEDIEEYYTDSDETVDYEIDQQETKNSANATSSEKEDYESVETKPSIDSNQEENQQESEIVVSQENTENGTIIMPEISLDNLIG